MSALVEFLLTRNEELEALAQRAAQEFEGVGVSTPPTWGRRQWEFRVDRRNAALVDYLVSRSPARVLAECEANRRIVEKCAKAADAYVGEWSDDTAPILADEVLMLLARPFADHPDFDPQWRML